jgi:hypothetical protein
VLNDSAVEAAPLPSSLPALQTLAIAELKAKRLERINR